MSQVSLTGRVYGLRPMGKRLCFGTLRCPEGEYFCVFPGRPDFPAESVVQVHGTLRPSERSRQFAQELSVESYALVSAGGTLTSAQLKQVPYSKAVLPNQHVYMRLPEVRRRLLHKWNAIRDIRDLMAGESFVEVQSPRIVGGMADGATMKFKVDFFGTPASLSLSNLLFHTAFVAADFSSVFEVAPLFRADLNYSSQHLSEFLILEATAAYRSRRDMMRLSDRVVRSVCAGVDSHIPEKHLDDIPTVTYHEVCAITARADTAPLRPGGKIKRYHAQAVAEHLDRTLFWVVDLPAEHKAFFSSTRYEPTVDADVADDFRLYWEEIDIVDGGERVTDPHRLRERLAEQHLDPDHFSYYLEVLNSGVPPLTGFGLGIERLLAKAMGLDNIRQLVPFPRFVGHLEP
ncbi:amino acid--tRNA ligase-related protein [Micromonospora sp. NPDC050417]|uniref:amino acid--tRNA ligase-related protein n=1 Tax=Micromonospora sp. NPDC050417 TaxID=3364280 RepID=UPI00378B587F